MNIEERNIQITEANQRLLNCCAELIRKLAQDPEAEISPTIGLMIRHDESRRTIIREKRKQLRNACDRFDIKRRISDALA